MATLEKGRLRYDIIKDFTPMMVVGSVPLVVVVNPRVPVKPLQELSKTEPAPPTAIAGEPRMLLPADAMGVFPIAPTPFLDDGSIDVSSIDLAGFYLGCGATGMAVLGQFGEAPNLEHAESVDVAARAVRLPVALSVLRHLPSVPSHV